LKALTTAEGCREISGEPLFVATTRDADGHQEHQQAGTVALIVDQKKVAPSTALGKAGGATWLTDLVMGVRKPAEHPFRRRKVPT
jgi:hypothetical protein